MLAIVCYVGICLFGYPYPFMPDLWESWSGGNMVPVLSHSPGKVRILRGVVPGLLWNAFFFPCCCACLPQTYVGLLMPTKLQATKPGRLNHWASWPAVALRAQRGEQHSPGLIVLSPSPVSCTSIPSSIIGVWGMCKDASALLRTERYLWVVSE